MHHQWSRYARQFRDDPHDIGEPLSNDSSAAMPIKGMGETGAARQSLRRH
jgi:hypothetical protein